MPSKKATKKWSTVKAEDSLPLLPVEPKKLKRPWTQAIHHILPLEVFQNILLFLPLASIANLRLTNRRFCRLVTSHECYHSPRGKKLLQALCQGGLRDQFLFGELWACISRRHCQICRKQPGPFLYLPTLTRSCALCLLTSTELYSVLTYILKDYLRSDVQGLAQLRTRSVNDEWTTSWEFDVMNLRQHWERRRDEVNMQKFRTWVRKCFGEPSERGPGYRDCIVMTRCWADATAGLDVEVKEKLEMRRFLGRNWEMYPKEKYAEKGETREQGLGPSS